MTAGRKLSARLIRDTELDISHLCGLGAFRRIFHAIMETDIWLAVLTDRRGGTDACLSD